MTAAFDEVWAVLAEPAKRALEQQYLALRSGGLACGASIADASGRVVAEGRNRAYDPPGGADILQGTPIAHAELNALALARTGWDLAVSTLWSTQQPCAMCATAAQFTGVGRVRYLAPDPWAVASGQPDPGPGAEPLGEPVWLVVANVLFLLSIARSRGLGHPTIVGYRAREPAFGPLMDDVLADAVLHPTLDRFAEAWWPMITSAARLIAPETA